MFLKVMINFGLFLIITVLLAVVLLEWSVGCGEPIYKADGSWETGECMFYDNEIKKGTWR